MIEFIVYEQPSAVPQKGEPVLFTRRTPAQSNLASCTDSQLSSWYNQIRMFDAESYLYAFLEVHGMRLNSAARPSEASLYADVKITPLAPIQDVSETPLYDN